LKILVVGGAGYIGSHMVKVLSEAGHDVVVFDNLISGHRDAVLAGEFVFGDLADIEALSLLFSKYKFGAVMHFAGFIQVGESVCNPALYYRNNVSNTQNLLDVMVANSVSHLIFSSTAAIFGEPNYTPIDESHPKKPINPYGRTKLIVEAMLKDYDVAYGLKFACLRYFNAAGAHPDGLLGERHSPETHLIPLVLQVASGELNAIQRFGKDYDTVDGTCIRDYVHVMDLCDAHLLALNHLLSGGASDSYNLGNGNGFSVSQVIDVAERVSGVTINVIDGPRREGDPAVLVADSSMATKVLGWTPNYSKLETIIEHAWNWQSRFKKNTKSEIINSH
jgi:UDP-glucose 4-epimerase